MKLKIDKPKYFKVILKTIVEKFAYKLKEVFYQSNFIIQNISLI